MLFCLEVSQTESKLQLVKKSILKKITDCDHNGK